MLGSLFEIKPICKQLNTLSKNPNFHNFIQDSPNNFKMLEPNVWKINQCVSLLYQQLDDTLQSCFAYFTHAVNPRIHQQAGRVSYLGNLSCTGNFTFYEIYGKIIQHQVHEIEKLRPLSSLYVGILAMIAAFLRMDLLDIYMCPPQASMVPNTVLLFLIKPSTLTQLKQGLNVMVEMNDETNERFNLLNYTPMLRLKFLYKLCWSGDFGTQIICSQMLPGSQNTYIELRKIVKYLYKNFELFAQEWNLNEYKHLHNNIIKQKEIHLKFQLIVQYLFGIGCLYKCKNNNETMKFELENKGEKTKSKKYNYIDLLPKDESDVTKIYNQLKKEHGEIEIRSSLMHPKCDMLFLNQLQRQEIDVSKDDYYLIFQNVLCPLSFMKKVYNVF